MIRIIAVIFILLNIFSCASAQETLHVKNPKESHIQIDSINQKVQILEEQNRNIIIRLKQLETTDGGKVDLIVSITSVLVALGLLIITALNNRSMRNILQSQIEEQKTVNRTQLRPILHAYRTGWREKTGLVLINYGQGPAAIDEIYFKRNSTKAKTISDLIDLRNIDKDIWWDDKWTFTQNEYFFHSQQKEVLYMITKKRLMEKYHKTEDDSEKIIKQIRDLRKGIKLVVKYSSLIDYENLKGNAEFTYEMALDHKEDKKTNG